MLTTRPRVAIGDAAATACDHHDRVLLVVSRYESRLQWAVSTCAREVGRREVSLMDRGISPECGGNALTGPGRRAVIVDHRFETLAGPQGSERWTKTFHRMRPSTGAFCA
jgi:hypothetical protein